jgi:ubiquinone/menaquinone biosynthesis C-methylase UbiE
MERRFPMPTDKSLYYYGPIYHRLLDPELVETRHVAVDLITDGSSVLDIACGTGVLCMMLHKRKNCRVVGIDLSVRMLEYARKLNPDQDPKFVHEDATDLRDFGDRSFDYATILLLMHELARIQQVRVLKEALRVAKRVIIIDAISPLPKNLGGIGIRIVEGTFGHEHQGNFKAFLTTGGIAGILKESTLAINVEHRSIFWRNCREAVVVTMHS